jgi:hypothetical protein
MVQLPEPPYIPTCQQEKHSTRAHSWNVCKGRGASGPTNTFIPSPNRRDRLPWRSQARGRSRAPLEPSSQRLLVAISVCDLTAARRADTTPPGWPLAPARRPPPAGQTPCPWRYWGTSRSHRSPPPVPPRPARTARPPTSSRAISPRRRQPPRRAPPVGNSWSSPGLATTAVGCPRWPGRPPTPAIGRWTGVFRTSIPAAGALPGSARLLLGAGLQLR